jgi:hypothetical protein
MTEEFEADFENEAHEVGAELVAPGDRTSAPKFAHPLGVPYHIRALPRTNILHHQQIFLGPFIAGDGKGVFIHSFDVRQSWHFKIGPKGRGFYTVTNPSISRAGDLIDRELDCSNMRTDLEKRWEIRRMFERLVRPNCCLIYECDLEKICELAGSSYRGSGVWLENGVSRQRYYESSHFPPPDPDKISPPFNRSRTSQMQQRQNRGEHITS